MVDEHATSMSTDTSHREQASLPQGDGWWFQDGQCRANTGANVGCRSMRSSHAKNPGRALRKCSRLPAHRVTTAASTSRAPGVSSPRYNSPGKLIGKHLPIPVQSLRGRRP